MSQKERGERGMKSKLTAIDLFSGAGGFHMGFERAGFEIKLCIDNNHLVERTHRRNFPHIPMINQDIRDIDPEDLKTLLGDVALDVMIGGPPCQGFSTIGKRSSSDPKKRALHDPRNDLVLTYANLVKFLQPKFIVMENVKGILTKDRGTYLENVLSVLREAGYDVDFRLVNMANYGVPQIRERVIIFGNRLGIPVEFPEIDHSGESDTDLAKWVNCWTVLEDLVPLEDDYSFNHVALKHREKNIARYKLIPEGGRLPENDLPPELYRKNFGNTYKRLDRKRPALTMVPGNDAFPIHPTLHRSLTVREAARIQTFPDTMIFEGNRRQQGHQVGNAVPPLFSEKLGHFVSTQIRRGDEK